MLGALLQADTGCRDCYADLCNDFSIPFSISKIHWVDLAIQVLGLDLLCLQPPFHCANGQRQILCPAHQGPCAPLLVLFSKASGSVSGRLMPPNPQEPLVAMICNQAFFCCTTISFETVPRFSTEMGSLQNLLVHKKALDLHRAPTS